METCDEFHVLDPNIPALDMAKFIYSKGIHILVDLNGWTNGTRQDVFSLRPAPI